MVPARYFNVLLIGLMALAVGAIADSVAADCSTLPDMEKEACLQARLRLDSDVNKSDKKQNHQKCNAFIKLHCECQDLKGAERKECIAKCIEDKDTEDICEARSARLEKQAERQAKREANKKCNAYIKLNCECSELRGAEKTACIIDCAESEELCSAKLQRLEKRAAKKEAKAARKLANKKCNAFITLNCECSDLKGTEKKDCIRECIAEEDLCEAKLQRMDKRADWMAKKMENQKCNAFIKLNCECDDAKKGAERIECLSKCVESKDTDDLCESRAERWNLRAENRVCREFIKDTCECDDRAGADKRACVTECINEEDSDDVCAKKAACNEFIATNCEDCTALEKGMGKQKCLKKCILDEDTENECEFQQMKYGQQMFSKWNKKQNEKRQQKKKERQEKRQQKKEERQVKKQQTQEA